MNQESALRSLLSFTLTLASAAGCRADIDVPRGGIDAADPVGVAFDPAPASDEAVAPIVHIALTPGDGDAPDPSEVVLVAGELTDVQRRYLRGGRLTRAVEERVVPFDAFDRDGASILAPNHALVPGPFTLAVLGGEVLARFTVGEVGPPRVERVFPPAGVASSPAALVYCADTPLTSPAPMAFLPAGPAGRLVPLADGCARFTPDHDAPGDASRPRFVPPVAVRFDAEGERAVDPAPLIRGDVAPAPGLTCDAREMSLAAGCALVEDDRVTVRAPSDVRFWSIQIVGEDGRVAASVARLAGGDRGDTFVLRGLRPSADYAVRARAIDLAGVEAETSCVVTTSAPRDHLILSEVLANPLGAEPAQEWVEIFNDGTAEVSLDGYVVADAGAASALPAAVVAPGGYVLVVNEGYDEEDGADPPPAAGCVVARVPKLGKNGLSNEGERITLTRGEVELSSLPAAPRPQPGKSVARVAEAIVIAPPTPCAPTIDAAPSGRQTHDGPDPGGVEP